MPKPAASRNPTMTIGCRPAKQNVGQPVDRPDENVMLDALDTP